LNVRLPRDLAMQVAEVQETDPEFLSRLVRYGLTRRSVFHHLRDSQINPKIRSRDVSSDSPMTL